MLVTSLTTLIRRAIVLELAYRNTPVQVVNAYLLAKGTAKEHRPLPQWLRAHVALDSRLVLLGGDFQCNPVWPADGVSVHTEMAAVLLEFATDVQLLPFARGMCGSTWVSAQGFVGALDFLLSRRVSPDISVVRVESESVFPSDHYPCATTSSHPTRLGGSWEPNLPCTLVCVCQCLSVPARSLCGQLHDSTFHAPQRPHRRSTAILWAS